MTVNQGAGDVNKVLNDQVSHPTPESWNFVLIKLFRVNYSTRNI